METEVVKCDLLLNTMAIFIDNPNGQICVISHTSSYLLEFLKTLYHQKHNYPFEK